MPATLWRESRSRNSIPRPLGIVTRAGLPFRNRAAKASKQSNLGDR